MTLCRTLVGSLILALSAAGTAHVRADAASDARKSIASAYARRDAAEAKKDLQGSLSGLAPDFVFVSKDGQKGDIKVLKKRLAPAFAVMQSVKSKSQIQTFALKGKDATATVKSHMEMLIVNPQTQVPQKVVIDATSVDQWTKAGAGWLQKKMVSKSETGTLDGKSIDDQLNLGGKAGKSGGTPRKSTKKTG